jgi:serine-type D-Ala-D-Ala carboxypeptidase/endopeptidase (penicillin-binding protein 4)
MNKRLLCLLAVFVIAFTAAAPAADTTRARTIPEIFKDPVLKNATVGLMVQDLDSGTLIYSNNPDTSFVPASNMKLITASAAMLTLGQNYRFKTAFHTKSFDPSTGAAKGLYVKGYGDPTMSGDFYENSEAAANTVAAELAGAGLKSVEGPLLLDGSFFKDFKRPPTWEAEDMKWCYAPRPGALAAGGNCLRITASGPGKYEKYPVIAFDPPLDPAMVDINVKISYKYRTKISVAQKSNGRISVTGQVRSGTSVEIEYPVPNPTLLYGAVLTGALKRMGVQTNVAMKEVFGAQQGFTRFHVAQSPDLPAVLGEMLKNSDNFVAEQVFRTLGGTAGAGGTHPEGAKVVAAAMQKYNLAGDSTLRVVDGSGLSRWNRLTPRVLLAVLSAFYNSFLKETFIDMLAAPGEEGTLKKRLTGTPAEGRLWAKTGALSGACSLSGYLRLGNGHIAAFTILVNGYSVHSNYIRALQDKIVLNLLDL